MFEDFDFGILDDPDFKEDGVREEIITPILKTLGYSSSGENRIIRGRNLTHPFVHIGTVKRKINIIPDYIIKIGDKNVFVLDAKGPSEDILKGKNVEQAFSYSIHSEVRTFRYALCNGKELAVYDIRKYNPVAIFRLDTISDNWKELEKYLSPLAFTNPDALDFHPDFGLSLIQMGINIETEFHFPGIYVNMIAKVNDNLYTITSALTFYDDVYAASFDFNKDKYEEFLNNITSEWREKIRIGLSQMPYMLDFNAENIQIFIRAKLKQEVERNKNEDYLPLEVLNFDSF